MAAVTARAVVWNTTAGAKTTASFTPGAGDLLIAVVGIATSDTAPTISDTDANITGWTLLDAFRSLGSAITGGLRIYAANQGAAGSAITVTMTPTGDAGGGLAVYSVTDPAGFGAAAARGTGGQADQAAGTPAPVLGAAPLAKNPIIVAVMTQSNVTTNTAPRTGFTEDNDLGFNTPATGLETQHRDSGETSATLTLGAATPTGFAAIAVEIATIARITLTPAAETDTAQALVYAVQDPIQRETENNAAETASGAASFQWNSVGSTLTRGVVVLVEQEGTSGDAITGVTYGGVAMARLQRVIISGTSALYMYFLGSGIPTGTQLVVVSTNSAASTTWRGKSMLVKTLDGSDTAVDASTSGTDAAANPSLALTTSVPTYVMAAARESGAALTAGGAYTLASAHTFAGGASYQFERTTLGFYRPAGTVAADWTGAANANHIMVAVALKLAGGPQSKTLTPAAEADAAQALSVTKPIRKTLTPAAVTNTAQALVVTKPIRKTLTVAAETDTAQALTRKIVKTLTAAAETDTAQVLSRVSGPQHVTLVPAAETDAARVLSFVKPIRRTLVAAAETDSAVVLVHTKRITLTPASEADTALALSFVKPIKKTLVVAAEVDTAQVLKKSKAKTLVPAAETDAARALTFIKPIRKTLVPAAELDVARALSVAGHIFVTLTPAAETDTARPLSFTKVIHKTLIPAAEVDAARALSFTKIIRKTLTSAGEVDVAMALVVIHPIRKTLTPAAETDVAQVLDITAGIEPSTYGGKVGPSTYGGKDDTWTYGDPDPAWSYHGK